MAPPTPTPLQLPDGVIDPYGLLEVCHTASTKEIQKAYRKKARDIHPDKNPDDPNAKINFHKLQDVYEFLLDKESRLQYDARLRREENFKVRFLQHDVTRRRFAEELEKREKKAADRCSTTTQTNSAGSKEVDRLKKYEAAKKIAKKETDDWVAQKQREIAELQHSKAGTSVDKKIIPTDISASGCLKASWNPTTVTVHYGVTQASIQYALAPFGRATIISFDNDKGDAIILLPTKENALEAALHFLKNKTKYHFSIKFISPDTIPTLTSSFPAPISNESTKKNNGSASQTPHISTSNVKANLHSYETSVLDRLKEAAKRQKLS